MLSSIRGGGRGGDVQASHSAKLDYRQLVEPLRTTLQIGARSATAVEM